MLLADDQRAKRGSSFSRTLGVVLTSFLNAPGISSDDILALAARRRRTEPVFVAQLRWKGWRKATPIAQAEFFPPLVYLNLFSLASPRNAETTTTTTTNNNDDDKNNTLKKQTPRSSARSTCGFKGKRYE